MATPAFLPRNWARILAHAGLVLSLGISTHLMMQREATEKVSQRFARNRVTPLANRHIRKEWRPRIGARWLASVVHGGRPEEQRKRIGMYFGLGFVAVALVYVAISPWAAPFMTLGTFAALYYGTTPRAENTWYPWDVPALFFGAATLLFAVRRHPFSLASAVMLAVPFKETLALASGLFWFFDGHSRRWRASWAAGTLAASLSLRLVLERLVHNPTGLASYLHVHGNTAREYRLEENLSFLMSSQVNHPIWANAGMWLLIFFLPTRDRVLQGYKALALTFYLALLLFGSFNEFRIFLEVLPASLLLASGVLYPRAARA